MSEHRYCVDTHTIIYFSQRLSPQLSQWMLDKKPYLIDVSEKEAIEAFKCHIADRVKLGASEEEISSKLQELAFLEDFFDKAKNDRRIIHTATDLEILIRAKELNENGITPTVHINDYTIAAACEKHKLILVTADNNLKRKLTKENEVNNGNFKLQPYEFITREATFQEWNQAK
jgi:predicted nucleic acid-binding protein